ncbi:MAG: Wzz/FepE/Etk N-terminal domain-containing protein, partial [Pseudomonadota bacterium]
MNRITNQDLRPPAFRASQPEPVLPDVVRYLRVLNRYKWGILMVVIAVGMLAAMYASTLRPIYRSTATLMLEISKPKIVTNAELFEAINGAQRDYFLTQFEIIEWR